MEKYFVRFLFILIVLTSSASWSTTSFNHSEDSKIIGGEFSSQSYPWMVSIQRGYHFCGGVLIGKDWVLTAAHCLENKSAEDLTLYIGLEHLSYAASGEVRNAEWFIIHPDYNSRTFYSDLAIIKLDRQSEKTPINLLSRESVLDLQQNEQLRVLGWGVTETGSTSRQLKEVNVSFQRDFVCSATYPIGGQEHYWDRSLCAGEVNGGKDSCQGDSGGPIIVKAQNEWALAGLVSWGSGCAEAGLYGVYSEVSAMSNWIDTRRAGVTLFGSGQIGFVGKDRTKPHTFTLQNLSNESQVIGSKSISNGYFEIDENNWLLGDELPANNECSFVVNADGLWAGERHGTLNIDLSSNDVSKPLNSKVLNVVDAEGLDTDWVFYSGTPQNTEHSEPWGYETDDYRGGVLGSGNTLSGSRSVLLTYLNGPVSDELLFLKFSAKVENADLSTLKLFINEEPAKTINNNNWFTYAVALQPGINHTMFIFYQSGGAQAFLDDLKICTDRFNDATCSSSSGYFNSDDLAVQDDPEMGESASSVCQPLEYQDSDITYVSRTNADIIFGGSQVSNSTTVSHMLGEKSTGGGTMFWMLIVLGWLLHQRLGVKNVRRFK